ncbi:Hypothetical protein OINT_2001903 [Brucella intermedia LMG 3301]|uniref:Uncharacterized protein n=1 Tax=Brucella intermedia LMG 3301 TaxID=641118 RepID=C4WR01_9HYPH|nr:Hypothetical protein OINT_2001903 [Brucella intermedia LMG 3301]
MTNEMKGSRSDGAKRIDHAKHGIQYRLAINTSPIGRGKRRSIHGKGRCRWTKYFITYVIM